MVIPDSPSNSFSFADPQSTRVELERIATAKGPLDIRSLQQSLLCPLLRDHVSLAMNNRDSLLILTHLLDTVGNLAKSDAYRHDLNAFAQLLASSFQTAADLMDIRSCNDSLSLLHIAFHVKFIRCMANLCADSDEHRRLFLGRWFNCLDLISWAGEKQFGDMEDNELEVLLDSLSLSSDSQSQSLGANLAGELQKMSLAFLMNIALSDDESLVQQLLHSTNDSSISSNDQLPLLDGILSRLSSGIIQEQCVPLAVNLIDTLLSLTLDNPDTTTSTDTLVNIIFPHILKLLEDRTRHELLSAGLEILSTLLDNLASDSKNDNSGRVSIFEDPLLLKHLNDIVMDLSLGDLRGQAARLVSRLSYHSTTLFSSALIPTWHQWILLSSPSSSCSKQAVTGSDNDSSSHSVDIMMAAFLCLGNAVRSDEDARAVLALDNFPSILVQTLLQHPLSASLLSSSITEIHEDEESAEDASSGARSSLSLKHAILGLIKNLTLSPDNRDLFLNSCGISSGMFVRHLMEYLSVMMEPLCLLSIGILKNLIRNQAENAAILLSTVDGQESIVERLIRVSKSSEEDAIKFEATRLLGHLIRSSNKDGQSSLDGNVQLNEEVTKDCLDLFLGLVRSKHRVLRIEGLINIDSMISSGLLVNSDEKRRVAMELREIVMNEDSDAELGALGRDLLTKLGDE